MISNEQMETYKRNLRLLKSISEQFHDMIAFGKPRFPVKIEAIDGSSRFIVEHGERRCFIHSAYSTEREMDEMFRLSSPDAGTLILFGVGDGSVFDAIYHRFPLLERILIVEPSLDIMRAYLQRRSVGKLKDRISNIDFFVNETVEHVSQLINQTVNDNIGQKVSFVSIFSYKSLFEDYFVEMSRNLARKIRSSTGNTVVGDMNVYRMIANTARNLIRRPQDARPLIDQMKGKPVLLVSAGPSLNKNMEMLKQAEGKAFVVAAGSAMNILDSNGIKADLRVAFSPHKQERDLFIGLNDTHVPLLITDMLYYECLDDYDGPVYRVTASSDYLAIYMNRLLGMDAIQCISELSVSNTAFEFLSDSGCSDIVLVGQDLAFTGGVNYARGALNNFGVSGRERHLFLMKDINGEDVYSKAPFMDIRDSLARTVVRNSSSGIRYYNGTEGGLSVPGIENKTLYELLESLPVRPDVALHPLEGSSFSLISLNEAYGIVLEDLQRIHGINEERIVFIQEMLEARESGKKDSSVEKMYNEINIYETRLKTIPFYSEVVQNQLASIINTTVQAYKYNGTDMSRRLDAIENIIIRVSTEVRKYCSVVAGLLSEAVAAEGDA